MGIETPQKEISATLVLVPHRVKVWVVWKISSQKTGFLVGCGGANPVLSTLPAQAPGRVGRTAAGGGGFLAQPANSP